MSIVEQVAPEVAVEVLTETEQRARTLEAAALEIEVRGWHQWSIVGSGDGTVCMAGAIAAALGLDGNQASAYEPAYHAWFGHEPDRSNPINQAIDLTYLPLWNDEIGRTAEEVTARLRSRAAELRSI